MAIASALLDACFQSIVVVPVHGLALWAQRTRTSRSLPPNSFSKILKISTDRWAEYRSWASYSFVLRPSARPFSLQYLAWSKMVFQVSLLYSTYTFRLGLSCFLTSAANWRT